MALKRDTRYPGRFVAANTAHPQGAFKNRSTPTAQDGSYLEADWANDWDGFFARILNVAGATPNGNADTGTSSQLYDALLTAMPGRFIGRQIFTASGTYTPTSGTKQVRVRAVGGGGGGGGAASTGSAQQSCAGGGFSGAYIELITPITSSSYSVIVGAAGTAGTATVAAGAGGASTVTGLFSAPGGPAGSQGVASGSSSSLGNAGPSSTLPTFNSGVALNLLPANSGEPFTVVGFNTGQVRAGRGGSNPFGIGGAPGLGGPGFVGRGYGAGGGGCSQLQGSVGDVGGVGLSGIIVIEEFA